MDDFNKTRRLPSKFQPRFDDTKEPDMPVYDQLDKQHDPNEYEAGMMTPYLWLVGIFLWGCFLVFAFVAGLVFARSLWEWVIYERPDISLIVVGTWFVLGLLTYWRIKVGARRRRSDMPEEDKNGPVVWTNGDRLLVLLLAFLLCPAFLVLIPIEYAIWRVKRWFGGPLLNWLGTAKPV